MAQQIEDTLKDIEEGGGDRELYQNLINRMSQWTSLQGEECKLAMDLVDRGILVRKQRPSRIASGRPRGTKLIFRLRDDLT